MGLSSELADASQFTVLGLFAGAAGLERGITSTVRGARAIGYVEREAYAASVLAARMESGDLATAPIWSDVSTFDGRPWRGLVDCISGGFPCQDISVAGRKLGIHGSRSGLWSEFARIVREVGPRFVFVENVGALVGRGLDLVLADLAALGFDAEWGVFRASETGAPHIRERLFVLAYADRIQLRQLAERMQPHSPERWTAGVGAHVSPGLFEVVGHVFPPGPEHVHSWSGPQPAIRRADDGLACRVDRLRLCGNGVVPQQASLAIRELVTSALSFE